VPMRGRNQPTVWRPDNLEEKAYGHILQSEVAEKCVLCTPGQGRVSPCVTRCIYKRYPGKINPPLGKKMSCQRPMQLQEKKRAATENAVAVSQGGPEGDYLKKVGARNFSCRTSEERMPSETGQERTSTRMHLPGQKILLDGESAKSKKSNSAGQHGGVSRLGQSEAKGGGNKGQMVYRESAADVRKDLTPPGGGEFAGSPAQKALRKNKKPSICGAYDACRKKIF